MKSPLPCRRNGGPVQVHIEWHWRQNNFNNEKKLIQIGYVRNEIAGEIILIQHREHEIICSALEIDVSVERLASFSASAHLCQITNV